MKSKKVNLLYSKEKFKSIIDNGILACEFLGGHEDHETYLHADFIVNPKNTIEEWQKLMNSASEKFGSEGFQFNRVKDYMTYSGKRSQAVTLIIDITSIPEKFISSYQDYKFSDFINAWPIENTDLSKGPVMKSVFIGVASTSICGIIIGDNVDLEEIKLILDTFYIPIFDSQGKKLY